MRTTLRRLLSTLGAVALVTTFFTASPAQAQSRYSLTALTIDGAVTPTSVATLRYSLSGTLPLRIEAALLNKAVGTVSAPVIPTPTATGSHPIGWDARWPAGQYELQRLRLVDSGGLSSETYERDGRIVRGGVTVGQHAIDFGAIAYSLSGPQTNELAPARLLGLKLGHQPPAPGAFSLQVNTSDVQTTLASVTAQWNDVGSVQGTNVPTGLSTVNGTVTTPGRKTLQTVTLTDQMSNVSVYARNGSATFNGYPTSTHTIDFAAFDLSVPDRPVQFAPEIQSIAWKKRSSYANEPSILTVTVTDDSRDAVLLSGFWTNPAHPSSQGPQDVRVQPGVPTDIPVSMDRAGNTSFSSIQLADASGIGSTYFRDGTMTFAPGLTKPHGFDLTQLDLTLRPGKPAVTIRPRPFGARIVWHAVDSDVATKASLHVTVSPSGKALDLSASTAGGRIVDIPGLVNGTNYTVTMVLRTPSGDGRPVTSVIRPMPSTNVFAVRDASGDNRVDVIARKPSGVLPDGGSYVYPTNGRGTFGRKYDAFRASDIECERVSPGDVQSNGAVLCFGPTLLAKQPPGHGYLLGTSGWSSMRFVDGGQDLTGDGWPDVVAVTAAGVMKIYQTGNQTRIVTTTTLGSGWNAFTALLQVGDFNGDLKADLVAVDGVGKLWLYPGNGRGGFGARVAIGSGWGNFGSVLPLRDFNGDGKADIGAITMDGKLLMYPGNGRGGFLAAKTIGTGWSAFL